MGDRIGSLKQVVALKDDIERLRAEVERLRAERDALRALLVRALAAFRHVGVVRGVDEWCEECEAALADAARKEGEG